ncbi:MipA/OmpV family protein [Caenimonas terrae]|uniref:MipA/OmpV family protein n=1 Tax=Caenimonas terrae TaxID=696074 RepID=A0ABW0N9T6_9BURK
MTFSARSRVHRAVRTAGLACAVLVPLAASAELTNEALIGPGLRSRPAYDGSGSQRTELVPVVRYFGQPLFVRSTQGVLEAGARIALTSGLYAGAQLAYEPGRQAGESGFLQNHNVADISRGGSIGLQMEWDDKVGPAPFTLLGRVRKNLKSELGTQLDLRLSVGVFHGGRFSAGVFGQAVWADAKATDAYYGVTAQQSSSTGLPGFAPGSGLLNTSAGLLWSVDLAPKWVVVGSIEHRRLNGDAVHSPLAQRRSNNYVSAGLAYRL